MKQLLYFLIGLLIPFMFFRAAYSDDTCVYNSTIKAASPFTCPDGYSCTWEGTFTDLNDLAESTGLSSWTYNDGYYVGDCYIKFYMKYIESEECYHHAAVIVSSGFQLCALDSDEDGIPDDFDLKPDSSESYKAAIVSVCYDENNKVVAGVIQDREGNLYSFGALPKDEDGQLDLEGYTITKFLDGAPYYSGEELSSKLQNLDIDDLNITKNQGATDIKPDGTFQFPDGWFDDYWKEREKQIKAPGIDDIPPLPGPPEEPPEQPDPNDHDSKRLDKIIKNTASTNENLKKIRDRLRITNDLLAKIKDKTGEGSSTSSKSGGAIVTVNTPSADEIGQAVEDNLIDPGQTIDKTITDNIPDLDQTDTFTAINTKYSERYDLFITTLKESDLFSLPFEIFSGPSGSGSSVQTVNIGKWGSSSEQTATIDYSDYDNIWQILRSVLLLLTSFACFKILVLKKG